MPKTKRLTNEERKAREEGRLAFEYFADGGSPKLIRVKLLLGLGDRAMHVVRYYTDESQLRALEKLAEENPETRRIESVYRYELDPSRTENSAPAAQDAPVSRA